MWGFMPFVRAIKIDTKITNEIVFQMCELLLQKGATVNHSDKRDRRPLHWAASRNHDDVARLLLQGRIMAAAS